jgi:FlaA1/EpsC-like NDP-sugar epimerase
MGESDLRAGRTEHPHHRPTGSSHAPTNLGWWVVWASRVRARLLFVLLDSVAVIVGYGFAEVVYLRDRAPAHYGLHLALFLLVALGVHLSAYQLFGLYGRMWRHAGIEEAREILLASATSLGALLALYPIGRPNGFMRVPLMVLIVGCTFVTMAVSVLRFHSRLFAWQRGARRIGLRVGVIGTRDAGAAVVREMLRNPRSGLVPVAVFDDDPSTHGLSLLGVPVVGAVDDIPAATSRYSIQQVLLAIPSPPRSLLERALGAAEAAGVAMKVLPGVRDMVGGMESTGVIQAREPRIEDLLGRTQVATDLQAVHRSLAGHRVLITGAGGSIGSEISRQVGEFDPSLVILLDHDETHLHDAAAFLPVPCEQALIDVADRAAVFEVFARYQPQVVFHAAAHKHVHLLEAHPVEAVTTNVFGTLNVVEAAAAEGVERFVCISTDKAVRPAGVMGATKWVAEQVVLNGAPAGAPYCAVRFGNVLGSRGSVIPTFARQIALGGPVTVTDPRMTRYFMSVEEAVQLVLQASVLATGGEIFLLDMGEPVAILDLAHRMIRLSGYAVGTDIAIRITGARPGEKIAEELYSPDEEVSDTPHPSVRRIVPHCLTHSSLAVGLLELEEAVSKRDGEAIYSHLLTLPSRAGAEVEV